MKKAVTMLMTVVGDAVKKSSFKNGGHLETESNLKLSQQAQRNTISRV